MQEENFYNTINPSTNVKPSILFCLSLHSYLLDHWGFSWEIQNSVNWREIISILLKNINSDRRRHKFVYLLLF